MYVFHLERTSVWTCHTVVWDREGLGLSAIFSSGVWRPEEGEDWLDW